jgi:glycosyltransferase involved in cell wall biosynthesis
VVILVRAFDSPFKGFDYFVHALDQLDTTVPLCILTTHDKGGLNRFIGKHQIVELGWVNDDEVILDSYRAADIMVMPSTAEAFGMMAIEAMACGKPVIVAEGTSLPEVTVAPEVGISVPPHDPAALAVEIKRLVEDSEERQRRGMAGRKIAEQRYDAVLFTSRLAEIYRRVATPTKGSAEIAYSP